jgi:hypothetical protein
MFSFISSYQNETKSVHPEPERNSKALQAKFCLTFAPKPNRHPSPFDLQSKTEHLEISSIILICQLFDAFYSNL